MTHCLCFPGTQNHLGAEMGELESQVQDRIRWVPQYFWPGWVGMAGDYSRREMVSLEVNWDYFTFIFPALEDHRLNKYLLGE